MEEMAWRILISGLNRVRRLTVYLALAGGGTRGAGDVRSLGGATVRKSQCCG